jgi:lipoyl(octanoyl) transferase
MSNWRIIIHKKLNGAWNMAVDEALLEFTAEKISPPTLRLYDWQPYTLSLGYAQPVSDVDYESLISNRWELVRRPTGGKAILHADELTYSVTAAADHEIMAGSVIESYQRLSLGLLRALAIIGINADSKPKMEKLSPSQTSAVCFQHPSDYEITFNNQKLIGSAQSRKKGGVLQHGSIPLFGSITRIVDVLKFPDKVQKNAARVKLKTRAITIENALLKRIAWDELADAVRGGFEQALGINFMLSVLTVEESKRAKEILCEKYDNISWTKRI